MTAKETQECLEFIIEYLNIEEKTLWKELNEITMKLQDKGLSEKQMRKNVEYIAAAERWGEAWIIKNDLEIEKGDYITQITSKNKKGS